MAEGNFFDKGVFFFLAFLVVPATMASGFAPVPVYSIYSPDSLGESADDALDTGHALHGQFSMAKHATKHWKIAYIFPHIKDPYWVGCSYGVIGEAKRLGISVDILPADGYDDLIGQLRIMDEAIAAGYDAIVISPISMTANNSSIEKARRHGIPVFELANDSTSDNLVLKVTTSLKGMGTHATKWVIRDAMKRGMKSVNIALLPGPSGAGWVEGEVAGTREAARDAPIRVHILDIRYGDSDRIIQSQLAAGIIARHGKNLDYIIGCTGCAPAARLPVSEARLQGKIRIVAYDLTREIAGLIQDGEISAAADTKGVSQARVVTDAAVEYLEGRKIPKVILIDLGMVDSGNYEVYSFDTSIPPKGYLPILSYSPEQIGHAKP